MLPTLTSAPGNLLVTLSSTPDSRAIETVLACCRNRLNSLKWTGDLVAGFKLRRLTAVAGGLALLSTVGVEISLGLLGELEGVLVLVLGRHFAVVCGWSLICRYLVSRLKKIEYDEERKSATYTT